MSQRTIKVAAMARVEGEGGLLIRYRGDEVKDVQLRIFEPPRFFEAFLQGRSREEVPDITARICGICPVAYQMSSVHALERAAGVHVDGALRDLRRLLYCGEWIESHTLHTFLLHAPDFLGYEDAIHMAADHGDKVKLGLRIKKAGNALVAAVGGREIHPINIRLGGFYRTPTQADLAALLPELTWSQEAARTALTWMSGFTFPMLQRRYTFVALRHPHEYPMNEGRVVSNHGLDIDVQDYEQHFAESHVPHSTSLHSALHGDSYHCGPLARFTLNFDRLPADLQNRATAAGLSPGCMNPFKALLCRMVELCYALDEAVRLIQGYQPPRHPSLGLPHIAGQGWAATEAPRGLLYHHYRVNADGYIETARIIPPTSQNQGCIEEDLRQIAPSLLKLPPAQAQWTAEQTVRNYDPCISCSTHFLKLTFEETGDGSIETGEIAAEPSPLLLRVPSLPTPVS